jgi:hypothetical protein
VTNISHPHFYSYLDPPAVSIQPQGAIAVNETSSVQMWCTFDANPPNVTEIIWYKDGEELNWNSLTKNKISSATDVRGIPTLTINSINRKDAAEYKCNLKNAYGKGNSTTSTILQVTCELFLQIYISFNNIKIFKSKLFF